MFNLFGKKNTNKKLDLNKEIGEDIIQLQLIFKGDVQGVGFRWEAYHIAQKLKLVGSVENLVSGHVLALVQGPRYKVDYFLQYMTSIPRANVLNVDKKVEAVDEKLTDFRIRY